MPNIRFIENNIDERFKLIIKKTSIESINYRHRKNLYSFIENLFENSIKLLSIINDYSVKSRKK